MTLLQTILSLFRRPTLTERVAVENALAIQRIRRRVFEDKLRAQFLRHFSHS